jgi:glycosyltransferase involved in cell wall biosynthesis
MPQPAPMTDAAPKKILLLIPTLDRSGAEKQLTLLATHLPREEFDVRVVALTRGGPYEEPLQAAGIPVTVVGKRFKFDLLAARRLRRLIGEWQPAVLHTWLFAANAYGRLVAGPRPKFSLVVSERCVDTWKSRWQLWLDRRLVSRTDWLVANSQPVADFYGELGYPAERIRVIHNACEPGPPDQHQRQALRRELGFTNDTFVLGYVGRLAEQKRVDDLLWAFELLRAALLNVGLVIVGEGPTRARLEHFAQRLQMTPQVRFLGHRDDVQKWLQTFDAFWMASSFEGQSNSLMEAMGAGLPVICSDIPPNRELVTADETGVLVPLGDRAEFARVAQRLMLDSEARSRQGEAARRRIQRDFSVSGMVEGYAGVYRDMPPAPH